MKAVRSLEIGLYSLTVPGMTKLTEGELEQKLARAHDERLFAVAEALRRNFSPRRITALSGIDPWFVEKIKAIVDYENTLARGRFEAFNGKGFRTAKRLGLADVRIAELTGVTEKDIRAGRADVGLEPVYKMVDTCAAEFEAETPYYYSTYEAEDEVSVEGGRRVVVLGSGPIRIGQGVEFDYCSVHCIWALRQEGIKAVIINNNPETVSTDFDTADRLYFEPLVPEDVMNILRKERPEGVVVQFGGQTAINLAKPVAAAGFKILGTSVADIDTAEDREKFDGLLEDLRIPRPQGGAALSVSEAAAVARRIGFPVLVRPSYVLGGRAMEIVYNQDDLVEYMRSAARVSPEYPVLVDKYIFGKEVEVDGISDGEDVLIPGIMEHVERAGVHSGDSIAVYPPQTLNQEIEAKIVDYTGRLARALRVRGLLNIQYVIGPNNEPYVLEVNPRASRTVPYLSKITGIPMISLATRAILGYRIKDSGYACGLQERARYIGVKVPVFSFAKLLDVDVSLGPEMKSTGEVMGVDSEFAAALYKGCLSAGYTFPRQGTLLVTVSDRDKQETMPIVKELVGLGFRILATAGTAKALNSFGIGVEAVKKLHEGSPNIVDLLRAGKINLVLNTLTRGKMPEREGFRIRRTAVELGVPCITSLDTMKAIVAVMKAEMRGEFISVVPLQEYNP
jgi:carbamoyl-phosphate synthase large subunit